MVNFATSCPRGFDEVTARFPGQMSYCAQNDGPIKTGCNKKNSNFVYSKTYSYKAFPTSKFVKGLKKRDMSILGNSRMC
jgi:hypothetical protein